MDKQYFTKSTEDAGTIYWFDEGNRRISFMEAPGNRHYEEYLQWVAKGNTAEVVEG